MLRTRNGILYVLVAAALCASFAIDLHLTRGYGGVDLRDKVVGSRSLMEGRSLYYDPWRPGQPDVFADPMLPLGTEMTRYTGTPFQALVMAPLAKLKFSHARLMWLILQYALLLLAIWLVARAFDESGMDRSLIIAGVLVLFIISRSWHLHVERGQVYVIASAILAGLFAAGKARHDVLVGVLAAALILLKPTYAVIVAPLVLLITPRMWAGAGATLLVIAGAFAMLPGGVKAWAEYRTAMQAWSGFVGRGEPPVVTTIEQSYPVVIEGSTELNTHHPMEFEDGSITSILHAFGMELSGWLPWVVFTGLVVVVVVIAGRRLRSLPAPDLLLLGFCGWTVLMWLLPVPRFDYQAVHWVAPLAVLLLTHDERPFGWNVAAVMAAALFVGAWPMLPVNVLMAEMIMVALVGVALWSKLHKTGEAVRSPDPLPVERP